MTQAGEGVPIIPTGTLLSVSRPGSIFHGSKVEMVEEVNRRGSIMALVRLPGSTGMAVFHPCELTEIKS